MPLKPSRTIAAWRQPLHALAAAVLLLAVGACARTTTVGGHNAWTIPGVVRLAEPDEPDSLNLMFAHSFAADQVDPLLFTHLLCSDANGNLIPDLALAVPTTKNGGISADGKTITLHLRHGVTWSDGAPVTAADWLFTYHAVLNPRNNVKTTYGWDDIASADAPNPYTIVIHLKKPDVAVLDILGIGGPAYPPLPAHLLAKLPDINHAAFNDAPISSGPFILKRWTRESSLDFVPNPHYWRGAPKLKELIWQVIPDTNSLLAALQSHEIDVYPTVDVNAVSDLGSIRGYTVMHRTIANWRHLGMNVSRPGLSDLRVRQAIAIGIDWKRLNATVYHGYNQLAVSDIFPLSWAAPSLPPYQYDPARARALLAAAGYTPAHPLHLTISATTAAHSNDETEVVLQADLRPLGIALSVHNYPANLLFAQNGPLYSGKYDLEWSVDTNAPDPDNEPTWNSAFIPPHGSNTSWLRDPIVDRMSAAASSTFDQTVRKHYFQLEEARLRAVVPAVFFYWETAYYAVNSDMHGFQPAAYGADTWNAWEWSI